MSEKFKNKYTIKSSRLANYDYSQNGMYFITICTKDREEFFGKIENETMNLSDMGKIANEFWQEIPKHFPFIILDEFVIMPNHMHGIIEIIKNDLVETQFIASKNNNQDAINQDALKCVSTKKIPGGITGLKNPSLNHDSLSNIIKWYKGRCSFEIRKNIFPTNFAWQPRFYDHIIRNEISLNKIREYIEKNLQMWERDRNLPTGRQVIWKIY